VLGVDTARPAGDVAGTISGAPDVEVEAIFACNVDTISAINRQRGIRTVWVGQVMNPILGDRGSPWVPEATSPWVPLVPNKDLLALIARLNDILKRRAARRCLCRGRCRSLHGRRFCRPRPLHAGRRRQVRAAACGDNR
jgi:hypothetical protein